MMMDQIVINGIKLTTLIGVHAWEQQCPQNVYLDLAFQTDAKQIAKQDNLLEALDYDQVVQHILSFVQNTHFQLIETLAEHLAQEILHHFTTQWVRITLRKPGALLHAKDVTIILERFAS